MLQQRSTNIASLQVQLEHLSNKISDIKAKMLQIVQMIKVKRRNDFLAKKQFRYVLHNYNSQ